MPRIWPTSAVTAAKTSSGGTPRATSVATRRSAACSSANPRNSTRACALAIAVATSSVSLRTRKALLRDRERAFRGQGNDHLIHAGKPPLPLGDDFRLKAGIKITGTVISTGRFSVITVLTR